MAPVSPTDLVIFALAALAWLVAVLALIVGAVRRVRRARLAFLLAAALQGLAGPLALGLAYASLHAHLSDFGAEGNTPMMLAPLGLAALVGLSALAASNVAVALARPHGPAAPG